MSAHHPLPDSIHRSLSVTCQRVDETVRELLDLLDESRNRPSVLRAYTPEERANLRTKLGHLQALNRELARRYSLDQKSVDERQVVHAHLTYLWTVLIDSQSDRWKSYGQVPGPHGAAVDRALQAMTDLLEELL